MAADSQSPSDNQLGPQSGSQSGPESEPESGPELQPQPDRGPNLSSQRFWLSLSLAFAAVYGLLALRQAQGEFVIQDDARQHLFWMQRFVDPQLFPNDLIADYFQSVAPWGYTGLYRLTALLGLHPLLLGKLLPLPLGLLSTWANFGVVIQFFPLPIAGFVSSLLLNQMLWMNDDLVSATPRAFIYPLFLGFCYFLLRRRLLPCLALILLQGGFYPQSVFLAAGLLLIQLVDWTNGRLHLSKNRADWRFCAIGLAVAVAVMLPYALHISQFDPVVTLAEARQMPEFQPGGRSDFFNNRPWKFWLVGLRSGLLPHPDRLPELLWTGLLLPLVWVYRQHLPLVQQIRPAIRLMPQLLLVSLAWFGAAHALLFRLHLPSRYTQHSLRLLLCWAAGLVIVIGLDGVKRWADRTSGPRATQKRWLSVGLIALVAAGLIFFPNYTPEFPRVNYIQGSQPQLYQFLHQQPAPTLIASTSEEASNLPSFAQRSVWVAKEYAIPYHMGYYRPFQQRVADLVEAQYSLGLPKLKRFIRDSGVDLWLLDRQAFTPAYVEQSWIRQYPEAAKLARRGVGQNRQPALAQVSPACTVFQSPDLIALDTACILNQTAPTPANAT
ncbi:MAG: hypothetical protein ACKO7W_00350 [Elainella sp.]